jgi:1-acyl-sn-glycerol-3-phosphate acyltransferase
MSEKSEVVEPDNSVTRNPRGLDLEALAQKPRPFYGLSFVKWAVYRATWWFISVLDVLWWRIRARGQEHLPRDGQYLLLPTHSTSLDPWLLAVALYRPLNFMASAQSLTHPILGPMLKSMGAFPKVKYVKDKSSMKYMTDLYDNGEVVTIFPEGRRNWDGHTQRILPGIGRTIKRMNARVVFCRMPANHFFQPRWAKYPRWIPLDIEYEGPVTYSEDATAEEITADVQRRLEVVPAIRPNARTWGFRIADGLTNFLWACPHCFTMEGLRVVGRRRDKVSCRSCGAGYRLDVHSVLHPFDGSPAISVRDAFYSLDRHFGPQPVQDPGRFESSKVVLREAHAKVHMIPRGARKRVVGKGLLQLTTERLEVLVGDQAVWGIPLEDVVAVSVELGSRTQVRTKDALYELEATGASVLKWGHFLKRWCFPDDPEPVG